MVYGVVSWHTLGPQKGWDRSGGLISGPLTDIPAEPLAMALSAHQTPTLGFRAGEDVSELSEGTERRR